MKELKKYLPYIWPFLLAAGLEISGIENLYIGIGLFVLGFILMAYFHWPESLKFSPRDSGEVTIAPDSARHEMRDHGVEIVEDKENIWWVVPFVIWFFVFIIFVFFLS